MFPAAPVAREWGLSGGDLADPGVLAAISVEILPRVRLYPGYLGAVLMVDRHRSLLRSLVFWSSQDDLARAAGPGAAVVEAVLALSSAQLIGRHTHDVVWTDLGGLPSCTVRPGDASRLLVDLGGVDDELDSVPPAALSRVPGSLGAVVLRDRERASVRWVSFRHEEGRSSSGTARVTPLEGLTADGGGPLELLACDLVTLRGRAGAP